VNERYSSRSDSGRLWAPDQLPPPPPSIWRWRRSHCARHRRPPDRRRPAPAWRRRPGLVRPLAATPGRRRGGAPARRQPTELDRSPAAAAAYDEDDEKVEDTCPRTRCRQQHHSINKQIHLVDERFILKIHQNTTNYSYTVVVSVSIRDLHHHQKLVN